MAPLHLRHGKSYLALPASCTLHLGDGVLAPQVGGQSGRKGEEKTASKPGSPRVPAALGQQCWRLLSGGCPKAAYLSAKPPPQAGLSVHPCHRPPSANWLSVDMDPRHAYSRALCRGFGELQADLNSKSNERLRSKMCWDTARAYTPQSQAVGSEFRKSVYKVNDQHVLPRRSLHLARCTLAPGATGWEAAVTLTPPPRFDAPLLQKAQALPRKRYSVYSSEDISTAKSDHRRAAVYRECSDWRKVSYCDRKASARDTESL